MMANEFEMSMIGELSYFLDLQIKQLKNETFVSQGKYIKDMIKKLGMEDAKKISTPIETNESLDSDTRGNMVEQKMYQSVIRYSDFDYAGCKVEKRSISGTCQLLGRSLVSWSSKKKNSVALSTAKAEYIAAGSCCALSFYRVHHHFIGSVINMQEQSTLMSVIIL
jgi:hypothetical protein